MLKKCSASKNGEHGVIAGGEGSRLEVEGCTLQQNVSCGAFAADTAELMARDCHSTGSGKCGFDAQSKATLTATDCSASGCEDTGFAVVAGRRQC